MCISIISIVIFNISLAVSKGYGVVFFALEQAGDGK
jgi:hypothetical protein